MTTIDLNADVGEGFGSNRLGDDGPLLDLVTSASIACGFHAGDPLTMHATVAAAHARGVAIGAHPGYPDLPGFGRRDLAATAAEIRAYVVYQVGALAGVCRAAGARLRFVKPHGALYNRAATDAAAASAIAEAVAAVDATLVVLALAGGALVDAARAAGLRAAAEAFADRAYTSAGALAPRSVPGAVLTDPDVVAARALGIVRDGRVRAADGTEITLHADSLCVHGDTPGALALARAVRTRFLGEGIALAPFAS